MRYKSFRIRNFKGIKDTSVELQGIAGANVFAFVGLNESGKTTVLEAIHSFAPDDATSELLGGEDGVGVPFKERVPRHLISDFTGDVSVAATLVVSAADKLKITQALLDKHSIIIDASQLANEMVLERHQRFKDGDYQASFFSLRHEINVRTGKQRSWRSPTTLEQICIRSAVANLCPRIAYFPTFVFDFPAAIFLTDRGGIVDRFYRQVFQDILDYDGRGHTIERDIVRRVRRDDLIVPWLSFLNDWSRSDDRDKIQHVMDRASAAVTRLVFGRWNKIFGEDTRGKEVVISYEIVEGERQENGALFKTEEHDLKVKFQIRDGTRRFDVNDRSLGFRWFFSFMLFTQFRVARSESGEPPLLFLFDEPASNLHAAAQQKLIESFPEITKGEHVLAYSTHSHYMIEPKWLEQTFIVTNRADAPTKSLLEEVSLDDESLDVQVSSYRSFVAQHPNQTSYFQPILDRLDVVPSKFDIERPSVVVEGKSDYYILRYAQALSGEKSFSMLPGLGAGTFGALAALHVGWNLNFVFLLDGDKAGKAEREKYAQDFGIVEDRLLTLPQLCSTATVIEDLLDDEAKSIISSELSSRGALSKSQIRRFFQERLASDNVVNLGDGFVEKVTRVLSGLESALTTD